MIAVTPPPPAVLEPMPGFPYRSHTRTWNDVRLAHIDEGPRDAPVALLIHGEPTWSYLYRKMIPGLLESGYRVVAPDHAGFGRSEKPIDDAWYTIGGHIEALQDLIITIDLRRITLFVQDWGGPIGLRQSTTMPERFERLVILNTWLHHDAMTYSEGVRWWRDAALDPTRLGGDMPTGRIVAGTLRRPGHDLEAVANAYDAPFTGQDSKAGARRFPFMLPFAEPALAQADLQARDFAILPTLTIPKHVIFGDADEIFTADWGRLWAAQLGATFDAIPGAGHFVQEDAGEDIVAAFRAQLARSQS